MFYVPVIFALTIPYVLLKIWTDVCLVSLEPAGKNVPKGKVLQGE